MPPEATVVDCPFGEHLAHAQHFDRIDRDIEILNTKVDRLPNWAVLFISALTFALGSAITVAGLLARSGAHG